MTTTIDLADLLARIESAPAPCRKLDAEIDAVLFGGRPSHDFPRDTENSRLRNSYGPGVVFLDPNPDINGGHVLTEHHRTAGHQTGSLDAADAVIRRAFPGVVWLKKSEDVATIVEPPADSKGWARHHDGKGATFALSMMAALVRFLKTNPHLLAHVASYRLHG